MLNITNHSHVDHLINLSISEDVGSGDITTESLPNPFVKAHGIILSKASMIVAGLEVAKNVFYKLDKNTVFAPQCKDGDLLKPGQIISEITGTIHTLLIGERVALNFLQRMSGIATNVHNFLEMLDDRSVRVVDTRKTIPGWRVLEKYAVRIGGAHNHRMGLYDGILIKDNHIIAFGGIKNAVACVRHNVSHLIKIEIEVSTMDEVQQALDAGADIIMLDNMNLDDIKSAVTLISGKAKIEVSGRVNKETINQLACSGVDVISVGALTHSAIFVDISMDINQIDD